MTRLTAGFPGPFGRGPVRGVQRCGNRADGLWTGAPGPAVRARAGEGGGPVGRFERLTVKAVSSGKTPGQKSLQKSRTLLNITIDCADARAQALFWAAALGWTAREQDDAPGHVEYLLEPPAGGFPRLYFTTVSEPKITKNRLHLDLIPPGDDPQRELARLTGLGATVLDDQPPGAGWLILADPEGNEFCLEGAGGN
jgi:catechol 2,3-dioxygenase-like lactoylglutathione lyase family enzyme